MARRPSIDDLLNRGAGRGGAGLVHVCRRTKSCMNVLSPEEVARGFTACAEHRAEHAARQRRHKRERRKDPVLHRRDLVHHYRYVLGDSPSAAAYRQRNVRGHRKCVANWAELNPGRRALANRLNRLVAAGAVTKPARCQNPECRKRTKLVGWNIHAVPPAPEPPHVDVAVDAWLCWGCWWARYREKNLAVGVRAKARRRKEGQGG